MGRGEANEGCCGPSSFNPAYMPGKIALTNEEFNEAVMEINGVLDNMIFFTNCFCPADPLRTKCSELTQRWANKRVEFAIKTKGQIGMDMSGNLFPDEKLFLVIRQMA